MTERRRDESKVFERESKEETETQKPSRNV